MAQENKTAAQTQYESTIQSEPPMDVIVVVKHVEIIV